MARTNDFTSRYLERRRELLGTGLSGRTNNQTDTGSSGSSRVTTPSVESGQTQGTQRATTGGNDFTSGYLERRRELMAGRTEGQQRPSAAPSTTRPSVMSTLRQATPFSFSPFQFLTTRPSGGAQAESGQQQASTPSATMSSTDMSARMDELRELRDAAEKERNEARTVMNGSRYMTQSQRDEWSARLEEAEANYSRYDQEYNDLLSRYYQTENEEKRASLQQDEAMSAQYQSAQDIQSDMDKVTAVMAYTTTHDGDAAQVEEYKNYLFEKYGLDQKAIDQYAIAGAGGAYVPRTDGGYNNIYDLYLELEKQKEQAVSALAEGGYDYERMTGYTQMQEDAERYQENLEEWQQYAREHPILSSVDSLLVAPFQGFDFARVMLDNMGHGDTDDPENYVPMNSYTMDATNYVNTVRQSVSEDIEENTDWELFGQNVASFLYQTGMSIGDSTLNLAAFGPTGALVVGSSTAAANQAKDIIDRGGTKEQAFMGGLAAGAFEAIFEKVSIDNLLATKSVTGWKTWLKETAKQAGVEASEETFTEIANILADAAIMGDNSNYDAAVREYIAQGMSQEDAERQAFMDLIGQVVQAGVGGALSGGVMGGTVNAVNGMANAAYNRYNQQQSQENTAKNGTVLETTAQETEEQRQNTAEIDNDIPEATRQAVEMLVRGEEISGNQAARIAENEEAVALLSQLTGEEVNTDAPISRVKSDIRALASREGRTSGEAGVNSRATQNVAQTQEQAQERPAAMQAYDVRRMEQAAQAGGFGESGRRALLAAYDGSVDGTSFYTGFSSYYNAGLSGMDMGKVQSIYAQDLTEAQRYAAYTAGQNDAAASLQREKAGVQFVPVYGDEAGLVDNDNAKRVPQQTAALYNTLAKAAGVKIELVDEITTPDGGRGGNGLYIPSRNTIQISMDTEGAVGADGKLDAGAFAAVAAHEITHRIQDLAPEQYRAYRDYAMNAMAQAQGYGTTANLVEGKLREYAEGGVNLTAEQAMDEIAADFTRDMLHDAGLFKGLAQEHRSVARRVLDALKDFIRRVKAAFSSRSAQDRAARSEYGVDMDTLEAAARLWQRAYDAATAQASGKSKSAAQAGGAGRFSIRYDQDNNPYVVIEEDILAGVPRSEWVRTVKDNLRQKFPNGVTVGRNVIEINAQSRREMTFSKYVQRLMRTDRQIFADKLRATNNADEILRAARNWVNEALLHPRRDAIIDFARGEVLMRIGSNDYAAQVIVGNRGGGNLLLYDIINLEQTEIQEKRTGTDYITKPQNGTGDRQSAPASDDSISETGGDVNGRYSLKEYTDEERKSHAKEALEHFGQTYSWKETGYLTQDGKKIDFSGRHDGGPGGYRTVDHRDVSEALGDDYGGDDYSGAMVQFMSEGNIRISPESGGINLSVRPTKAQEQALEDFISRERGEVILDIDEPGGDTVVSVEYPRGTRASKVINDIRQYFEDGTQPYVSQVAQFRYSLKPTDSRGRELSEEQRRYFQGSKITDADGRLLVLYHGTTAYGEITKFRRGRSGWLGPGIYLASRQADAKRYADAMGEGNGQLYELYANVTNPLVVTEGNPVPEILRAAYGRDSVYRSRSAKQGNDAQIITTADIKKLQSKGYDGIRWDFGGSTEVSVFSPEQIKRVDNLTPTSDPDIRRSIKGSDILRQNAALQEENSLLRERVEYWRGQTRRTERVTTDKKAVERAARELIRSYNSSLETAEIAGDLQSLYDYIASGRDGSDELTYTEARRRSDAIARKLVDSAAVLEDDAYRDYADLRSYLRSTPLSISAEDSHDIADFGDFRRRNFGRMTIRSGPTNIDQVYQEMSGMWPEFFDETRESTPRDQLVHIAEVLDGIYRVTERNPFSGYFDAAVTDASNEIMERFFDLPQTRPTFADRQARKLDDAKAAGRRRLAEQRERSDARLNELRQQNRERVQRAIQRERETRARQIDRLKTRYAARDAAGRERRSARELRARISRHVADLSRRLLRPSDKQHIPEQLRTAVAAMLDAINLESVYTVDPVTGRRRKGGNGDPTKRTEAFRALREQYAKIIAEGGDMVIDPLLMGNDAEGIRGSFDAVIAMGDTRLADMSTQQLEIVWQVVKAVEQSVSTAGKILSKAKFAETAEWANAMQRDTAGRRAKQSLTKGHPLIDLETPYTFFSHFGDAGRDIYRMLRDAQDQQQLMADEVAATVRSIISPKEVRKLERTTQTFTTERGDNLTLSTAQIMELYELTQREQAHDHLLKGGVVQPEIESAKIRRGTDAILLTEGDLASIVGTLTDQQKQTADKLQRLTTGLLADYGNQASMAAYGYRKFTEDHYWPLHSAKEGIRSSVERGSGQTRSIANIGLAQAVIPHANNPLDLPGLFSTFSSHAGDMIDYAAWLLPMEDANRLFNFKFRDGEGNLTGRSVKGLLDRVGGEGSQRYWHNLMEDIQNGINAPGDSPMWDKVGKSIGSFKGAAVGGNLRVIIQQPTAFFRAGMVLSPADLSRGLARGVTRGNGWRKALQYSPIAKRKNTGSFDISSPRQMNEILFDDRSGVRKLNDALSAPAGMADAVTWGKLWNACEWATAREHKSLRKGSEAFYQKVNELFTGVIDQTQVVDGVLQRSNIMRSSNAVVKQATSFMGEPIMSLNLMMRAYDQVRYEQNSQKRGKAIKTMGRAATALVVTNVVNALAQSLIDAMRDDDEDKKYWERFRAAFTGISGDEETPWEKAWNAIMEGNVGSNMNPLGQIPFVKDALSIMQGYDVSRTEMEIVSDLIQAGQTAIQSADGQGKRTRAYALKGLLAAGAKMFGIPASNLARDMWGLARSAAVETGNIPLQYEMEKAIYNISNTGNKNRYYAILYRALEQGDMDTYQHIRDDLMNSMGVDGASIDSAMRSRYNKAVEKDPDYTLPQRARDLIGSRDKYAPVKEKEETFGADDLGSSAYLAYSDQRANDYRSMANDLTSSPIFRGMDDETRDKVLKAAYDLADKSALADHSDGQYEVSTKWMAQADDAEAQGIEPWEYVLFHTAYNEMEGTKDADGKTVKGEAKSDHVREWLEDFSGLTDEQRAFLWGTVYTSEW